MAARTSWTGTLDLGGFPIHVSLYNRIASSSGAGFKMLAPNGSSISQKLVDSDGKTVERGECGRAIDINGQLVPVPQEALDTLNMADRSGLLEPEQFASVDSLPLDLATSRYNVVPNGKVPGSDRSLEIIANGLADRGLAYVTRLTIRSGSADSILVIYVSDGKLRAAGLPFEADLNDVPEFEFTKDDKAAAVFSQFVDASYGEIIGEFDLSAFESEFRKRRDDVIAKVLEGVEIEVPEAPAPATEAPDLLAALSAAVAAADKPKAKSKAKPRKASKSKPKAKVAA
jgi:non-homologous end joining protein Ku